MNKTASPETITSTPGDPRAPKRGANGQSHPPIVPDPAISTLLGGRRPLRSLEFFAPKDDTGSEALRIASEALQHIRPDFVSVTYGAGGSTRDRTAQSCDFLRHNFGLTVMPHLTCVGHSRHDLTEIIDRIHAGGFRNVMALRGDPPKGESDFSPYQDGFHHASELVALIKSRHPDVCVGVGGYPEKHPEAPSLDADLANLRLKVDAGADFITTQLFFDNTAYYRFVDRCRALGIAIPIVPGILPVLSLRQIQRFTALSGAGLPGRLLTQLEAAGNHDETAEMVGIDWALHQIRDLLAHGVPGYHLYVLNRAKAALALTAGLAA